MSRKDGFVCFEARPERNAPVEHCLSLDQGVQRRVRAPRRFGLIRNAPGRMMVNGLRKHSVAEGVCVRPWRLPNRTSRPIVAVRSAPHSQAQPRSKDRAGRSGCHLGQMV